MTNIESIFILFAVGSFAGLINVNAGGGSTLTLPTLIFLGLDASVANGTNRIALFVQNLSAVYSFKKEEIHDTKLSLKLGALTLPGAIVGAIISTRIENSTFEVILGIVMITIVITMFIPRKKIELDLTKNKKLNLPIIFAMLGIGFYGGFIQIGVGFILMTAIYYLMRLNLVYVNMHKVFVVLIYTIPAMTIFILTNNVNWFYGISLAAGNALGAWWGAKFSVKKGEKFIKIMLIVAILIMASELLGIF